MKNFKSFFILFFVGLSTLGVFVGQSIANESHASVDSSAWILVKPDPKDILIFAHRGGKEAQGGKHSGKGCKGKGMGHQKGQGNDHGGKGCKGMGHQGGMKHGMGYGMGRGPGLDGEAQCPQTRSTSKAPESLYSKTNPLENTPDNIEKGRMLFQLDAQPTCTVCHGSGNGLGMMSGGLNPPPRNFMCKETMESISDGQLFWIIRNGSAGTGMPAFSDLSDDHIWQLILFLRTLAN